MARSVYVDLIFDAKNSAKKAIDEAEKQLGSLGKKASEINKDIEKNFQSLAKGAGIALGAMTAAGAALLAAGAKGVAAANVQENAIKRLNTSLKTSGSFSESASKSLQEFASQLQSNTRFGDELILNQLALAKSFGASNEQAKQIVKTATDLSESMGIDLESATRNVSKTLGGFAGELGETIPALKKLTKEQLMAGEGVALLSQRFEGAANEQVKTFSGRLEQLGNTVGDTWEQFGFVITRSDAMKGVISGLTDVFANLIQWIAKNEDGLQNLVKFGVDLFIKGIKGSGQIVIFFNRALAGLRIVLNEVVQGFLGYVDVITTVGSKIPGIGDKFAELNESALTFGAKFNDSTNDVIEQQALLEEKIDGFTTFFVDTVDKRIDAAERESKSQVKQFEVMSTNIEKKTDKYYKNLGGIRRKNTSKLISDIAKEQISLSSIIGKKFKLSEKDSDLIVGGLGTAASGIASGNAGSTIGALSGVAANTLLPGSGGIVGPLVELMGKSSEELRANIRAFGQGAVQFIQNFVDNIPIIIEELIKMMPDVAVALTNAMVRMTSDPNFWISTGKAFVNGLLAALPKLAEGLTKSVASSFGGAGEYVLKSLLKIVAFVPNLMMKLFKFDGGGKGVVENFLGLDFPFVKFSKGGFVPGTARFGGDNLMNDTVPALLSPGEFVLSREMLAKMGIQQKGFGGFIGDFISGAADAAQGFYDQATGAISGVPIIGNLVDNLTGIPSELRALYRALSKIGSINLFSFIKDPVGEAKRIVKSAVIDGALKPSLKRVLTAPGLANGGVVPMGYPNDTFPARLSSNEFVVRSDLTSKLESFLSSADGDGGESKLDKIYNAVSRPIEVSTSIEFNQQTLGDIILRLNRTNTRVA